MRVYRFRDLRPAGVHFVRKHIRDLELRGEFPQRFKLGEKSVGWVAEEVDAWVDAKIRARRPVVKVTERDTAQAGA